MYRYPAYWLLDAFKYKYKNKIINMSSYKQNIGKLVNNIDYIID